MMWEIYSEMGGGVWGTSLPNLDPIFFPKMLGPFLKPLDFFDFVYLAAKMRVIHFK